MHLFVLLFLSFSVEISASVTASVDQNKINYGQSIQLNIKSNNAAGKTPNLTVLKRSFHVIGSSKVSRPYIQDSQRKTKTLWFYILKPKLSGTVVIPAISVNGEKTKSINIRVLQKKKIIKNQVSNKPVAVAKNTHNIIVKASLNKKVLYPNEMLVYHLSINAPIDVAIKNLKVVPPFVPNAIVLPLAMPIFKRSKIRGKPRQIRSQSFAIFSEQVAIYQIEPAKLVLTAPENSATLQTTTLKANNLHFEIQPKANQTSLGYWLPSPKIVLTQHIEPYKDLVQGDTIRRTITIQAHGLDVDSLPLISSLTHQDIAMSLEDVSVENIIEDGKLLAKRSETVAMTFHNRGSISIDPIDLHWWNTQLNQARVATLAAQSFNVGAKALVEKETPEPKIVPLITDKALQVTSTSAKDSLAVTEKLLSNNQLNGIIALLFALLVATTTGWLFSSRKKR